MTYGGFLWTRLLNLDPAINRLFVMQPIEDE